MNSLSNTNGSNSFFVSVRNKRYHFIRTESRFFDITNCTIPTNGTVVDTLWVSDECLASVMTSADAVCKRKAKASGIKRIEARRTKKVMHDRSREYYRSNR